MKLQPLAQQWALAITVLFFALQVSAISTRRANKSKNEHVAFKNAENESLSTPPPSEKLTERKGLHSEYEHYDDDASNLETSELVKKTQNISVAKPAKDKEESPVNVDVVSQTDLEGNNEEGDVEHLAKADHTRESRGDKNPRIYYDDAIQGYPHGHYQSGERPEFKNSVRAGKQKDGGKFYFPENYLNSKNSPKKFHNPLHSVMGAPGKRAPDHVSFDEEAHEGHDYPLGHGPIGHEHEYSHGPVDEAPYPHGIEHHGKSHGHHHLEGYGYHHHYGNYRHTIGDKVDAVGKALQVLIPSALLITGVSALFPNRVHVPTTPNKHRQKRSLYRRIGHPDPRMMMPPPPVPHMPPPEFDDIPSHILHAEHRIMDANPMEMYPEYGKRQGSIAENHGFDPFRVFKGPGPETAMKRIHDAIPLPEFPNMPDMAVLNENTRNHYQERVQGVGLNLEGINDPPSTYGPTDLPDSLPPPSMAPQQPTPQMSYEPPASMEMDMNERARPSAIIRRRKPTTKKPPVFMKETPTPTELAQRSTEDQKTNHLGKNIKNSLEDFKIMNPVKAEEEFMASLQNLVTPEIAKAIVKNREAIAPEPSNKFDLSPDGPVMGLLTSYANHEKDSPLCQKRALCELAVKGKNPKSTKFEAFLWSVATLVPDVFSEMYDLQEVFQAIRDERCVRFECANPNLDIQYK